MARPRNTKPRYRSKYEQEIAKALTKAKIKFEYEPLAMTYQVTRTYTPDFWILKGNARPLVIEAKGYFTSADRTKTLKIRDKYPLLDLRLLFQNANVRLSKKSKTTYGQWAERNGIPWAQGPTIPTWWINA